MKPLPVLFQIYVNTEDLTNYSSYVVILQKQQSYELALIKLKIKCDNFLTRTIYDKKIWIWNIKILFSKHLYM